MMFLQRTLLLASLVLFACAAQAQITILGGGSLNSVSYTQKGGDNIEDTYTSKFGFHGGVAVDFVLSGNRKEEIVFEAGLLADTKGAKQEYSIGELSTDNTTNLYYVDVPLYLKYRYKLRSRDKVYAGIGAFVGAGVYGKLTGTVVDELGQVTEVSQTVSWDTDESPLDLKRLDYGASVKVGYLADNGLNISASYDYGIPNIASMGENIEIKTRVARISLGYTFKTDKRPYKRRR